MKCKSVACIWSTSPPVHRVTAAAVLDQPPTLYTGGSDGSVIWWNLISSHDKQEIKPIAMLCGHAAPIADLGVCFPAASAGNGKLDYPSNVLSNSNSVDYGALISACTDGVLCVWSRAMGHCRRRRKLPPWVGSPSMLQPLPENGRYVCIACCFGDYEYPVGESETSVDKESQQGKPSKYTVLIVDSYTLTIVQTVFHGNLSIGPLKSMTIVVPIGEMEKWSVMMIDSFGKVQYLPIMKKFDLKGDNLSGTPEDLAHLELMDCVDGSKEKGPLVTFAKRGRVIALVYRTYCTFKLVDDGTIFGKISFLDDQLCLEDKLHVTGGMFLGDDEANMRVKSWNSNYDFMEEFAVWNDRGSAVIYRISYSCNMFMFERLAAIPAALYPPDLRLSILFIPFKKYLLRIGSICFSSEEPSLWKPHVTLWQLPQHHGDYGKLCPKCEKLGEGTLFDVWDMSSSSCEIKCPNINAGQNEISVNDHTTTLQSSVSSSDVEKACTNNWRYGTHQGQPVSSSMVISDSYLAPCAIVYGFFNGEIEVVRFNMFFTRLDSNGETPSQEADACAPKQSLSGHTGAVLCLASHPMMSRSGGCSLNHVLLSGSIDCTVRVWDLDTCNPIMVMHQHVAPVRQIILPPNRTAHPWSDCFLTVGDDSSVTLASLETLRVERMFPGHPSYPAKVVWDGIRGYVACFCPKSLETSDSLDMLYIWDVKTGARERVLRGAAAHSMFDHFCMVINKNEPSGIVMNVNTSASSLHFPITEETKFSESYSKYSGHASSSQNISPVTTSRIEPTTSAASNARKGTAAKSVQPTLSVFQSAKHLIKSSCPFPGIATLCFDLTSLMSLCSKPELFKGGCNIGEKTHVKEAGTDAPKDDAHMRDSAPLKELGYEVHNTYNVSRQSISVLDRTSVPTIEHHEWVRLLEEGLLQFSLSFLHLWNVDHELDNLLVTEMRLKRPDSFIVASGLIGDRGSLTLTFPCSTSTLELWKSSPVYSAMRSLTMVSLAQHLISLSHSCSSASSALAAFYMRKFAEKIPDIKPPLLQLLVSFWQDEFEHVKMAARSLFHCAASRAIPLPLCCPKITKHTIFVSCTIGITESEHKDPTTVSLISDGKIETQGEFQAEEYEITSWIESYEMLDWISCVRGTSQDAMASQIIVAAALAVWYSSLVKPRLAIVVVHPLMKLVMATNEKYSCIAAEILAEGMESTWKACIGSEISRLIGDIFFQVECVSGASAQNSAASLNIRETLVGILLPSLAMADIPGFLHVIESQIWSTASDSPVHVVSLMTLIRVVRGSPRSLAPYLDKVCRW